MSGWFLRGGLVVALAAPLLAGRAGAETITFINDTKGPVVVQMASVVGGGVRRDRPYPVFPGEKVKLSLPGNKLVNLYDARIPNRILFQGPIPAGMDDQAFSIQVDPMGLSKLRLQPVPVPAAPTVIKPR